MKMERQVFLPNISVVWRLEKSVDQYFRFVVYECQIVDQLDPWPMRFPIRALPGADYYIRRGFSLLACFLHGRSEIACVPFPDFIVLSIHVLSVQTATDATNLCRVGLVLRSRREFTAESLFAEVRSPSANMLRHLVFEFGSCPCLCDGLSYLFRGLQKFQ